MKLETYNNVQDGCVKEPIFLGEWIKLNLGKIFGLVTIICILYIIWKI